MDAQRIEQYVRLAATALLVLGCILGPVAETSFLTTMISYRNDWTIFFTRPVSAAVMALTALALLYPFYRRYRRRHAAAARSSVVT